jgi:hypothetical protein
MNGIRHLNELMSDCIKSVDYISKYMEVTDEHIDAIIRHCSKYNIKPKVCAWYKNIDDFYSDWMGIGYTKETADRLLTNCKEEFQKFKNGNIIRYEI